MSEARWWLLITLLCGAIVVAAGVASVRLKMSGDTNGAVLAAMFAYGFMMATVGTGIRLFLELKR